MRRLTVADHPAWRTLAALLDLRVLLVLLGLHAALWPGWGGEMARQLDDGLFSVSSRLRKPTTDVRSYVRVDVPAAELALFEHDPVSARPLMRFFRELQQSHTRGVAVVLSRPLWIDFPLHEQLLAQWPLMAAQLPTNALAEWQDSLANMRLHSALLADERLFFSVPVADSVSLPVGTAVLPAGHVYQLPAGQRERTLLLQQEQQLRAEAVLELFLMQQGLRNPEWLPGQGLRVREHLLRTSADAVVLPRFSGVAESLPLVHMPLARLQGQDVRRLLHDKTVVVGREGDAAADELLLGVISLASGDYAVPLPQQHWLVPALALAVTALLLVLPWLPWRAGVVLVLLAALALVLAQQILLLVQRDWLPVARPLLLLPAGYVVILLWAVRRQFYPLTAATVPVSVPPVADHQKNGWLARFKPIGKPVRPAERQSPRLHETDTLLDTLPPLSATAALPVAPPSSGAQADPVVARAGGKPRSYLGRYQVQRELGRGAMGVVYLGFDPKISRQVAIKTLHYNQFDQQELPAVKERFFREAAAAGRLRHPNIVTIYDAGEESDLAYIAMDYVNGDSLASWTQKERLLDVEMVYWIMAQVADAVDYANAQGIIHRDLKPSNILFDNRSNEVKVADFGIARIMDGSATRTRTGDILGSPLYMSPEQLKGEGVGPHSDVFSLGVTFYQLLAGELPFKGDNFANLSFQIVQGKFRSVDEVRPGLPDSARRITAKALQKNPDNRYGTAGDMADALQRALEKDFRR